MLGFSTDISRRDWLAAALSERRSRIVELMRRLAGLGAPGSIKPELFHKFLELMGQIADERDKEIDLIGQIETVEEKHRFRRDCNQLEQANACREREAEMALAWEDDDEPEEDIKPKKAFFFALMDQIADDREKEIDLINQIETAERMHRFRRGRKQLEKADADEGAKALAMLEEGRGGLKEESKPNKGLLWFALLCLALALPKRSKNV
jgi:hypothetical protein